MLAQRKRYQNLTETFLVLGITAISTMPFSITPAVNSISDLISETYKTSEVRQYNQSTDTFSGDDFIFSIRQTHETQLDKTVKELFGEMRAATKEESESIKNYIQTIAKDTGVNFF